MRAIDQRVYHPHDGADPERDCANEKIQRQNEDVLQESEASADRGLLSERAAVLCSDLSDHWSRVVEYRLRLLHSNEKEKREVEDLLST